MQPIIVIAVIKLGTNNVKPFALFAKLFAAVPNTTARIRIRKAITLLTNKRYSYLVILSTNFLIGGPTRRAAIIAIGRLIDHALIPIIKAAKGTVSTWKNDDAKKAGNIICSANTSLHNKMLKILKPVSN